MDSEDYKKGCLQILSDKEFYEELPENQNITHKKNDAKVDTLLSNDIIAEFEASNLTLGTRTPCFYGLQPVIKPDRFRRWYKGNPVQIILVCFICKHRNPVQNALKPLKGTISLKHWITF